MLIIDRFDGKYAVCEGEERKMFAIPIDEVPDGAKEGDCLRITDEGELVIDEAETAARRKQAASLQKKLYRS